MKCITNLIRLGYICKPALLGTVLGALVRTYTKENGYRYMIHIAQSSNL